MLLRRYERVYRKGVSSTSNINTLELKVDIGMPTLVILQGTNQSLCVPAGSCLLRYLLLPLKT